MSEILFLPWRLHFFGLIWTYLNYMFAGTTQHAKYANHDVALKHMLHIMLVAILRSTLFHFGPNIVSFSRLRKVSFRRTCGCSKSNHVLACKKCNIDSPYLVPDSVSLSSYVFLVGVLVWPMSHLLPVEQLIGPVRSKSSKTGGSRKVPQTIEEQDWKYHKTMLLEKGNGEQYMIQRAEKLRGMMSTM